MVVNKEELVRGSPLGPAPAGPAAEAADRYLNGGDRPAAGGAGSSVKGRGTIQEEPVTAPRTKNAPTDYASSGR